MTSIIDPRMMGISPAGMAGSYSGGSLPMLPNVNLKPVTSPATGGQTANLTNINRTLMPPSIWAQGGSVGINPHAPNGGVMLPSGGTPAGIPRMGPGALDFGAFLRQMRTPASGSLTTNRGTATPLANTPGYYNVGNELYNIRDPNAGLRQETYTRNGLQYFVNPRVAQNTASVMRAQSANPGSQFKMINGQLYQYNGGPSGGWSPAGGGPAATPNTGRSIMAGSGSSGIFPTGTTGSSMTGMRPGATSPPAGGFGGGQPTGGGYIRPGTALGGPFQIGGSTMADPVIQRFQMLSDQLNLDQADEERYLWDRLSASGRDPGMGGGLMKGLIDLSTRFNAQRSGLLGSMLNEDERRALEHSLGNMQAQASRYGSDKQFAAAQLANQLGQSRLAEERRQYNTGFPLQTLGTLGPLLLGLGQFGQGGISGLAGSLGGAQSAFPTLY